MANRLKTSQKPEKGKLFRENLSYSPSSQTLTPKFSFEKIHPSWHIKDSEHIEKSALVNTLCTLGKLTWAQINQASRHKNGFETIPQKSLRVSCDGLITEDVTLIAFRYHEMKPMVGYRDGEIFYILFFDSKLNLYDHG